MTGCLALLLDRQAVDRGFFRRGYVESVLARHRSGKEDLSRRILTFVMLELWHRTFVDTPCIPVGLARGLIDRRVAQAS